MALNLLRRIVCVGRNLMRKTIGWIYAVLLAALTAFAIGRLLSVQRDLRRAGRELTALHEMTDRLANDNDMLSASVSDRVRDEETENDVLIWGTEEDS